MKPHISFVHVARLLAVVLAGVATLASPRVSTAATKDSNTGQAKSAVVTSAARTPATAAHEITAQPAARRAIKQSDRAAASTARAGIVVGIDPATGRLAAPTPDQMSKIARSRTALPGRSAQRPAPVFHANGSVSLDVRSWMREHAVVRLGPDGRVVTGCLDNRAAAGGAAQHAPLASPALEER